MEKIHGKGVLCFIIYHDCMDIRTYDRKKVECFSHIQVFEVQNSNLSLRCASCTCVLADAGFVRNAGRALCRDCHAKEKASGLGRCLCHKCHTIIDEPVLRFKGMYIVLYLMGIVSSGNSVYYITND